MLKFKALPTNDNIVGIHDRLLEKREKNKERIRKLYTYMKEQYEKVVKEIEAI